MTDWLATITDPTLRRIAMLERETRRLHRRADNISAVIRALVVLLLSVLLWLWLLHTFGSGVSQ